MLCDGVKPYAFDEVSVPVFTADGRHLVYLARRGKRRDGKMFVVYDDTISAPWSDVYRIAISPDGERVACAVRGADHKLWYYVGDMQSVVSAGNMDWRASTLIGFSDDSRHIVYCARFPTGMTHPVVDGLAAPGHEELMFPKHWNAEAGKVRFIAIDKGKAKLMEIALPKDRSWLDAFAPVKE
jgi:hypothetical protein